MSSHWVRLERVSWVRPTATTLVTAKRPYAARVARLFDELADDFTRDRSSAIGVATVNHRDDLDDEAVFEDPVEDAVLASPC